MSVVISVPQGTVHGCDEAAGIRFKQGIRLGVNRFAILSDSDAAGSRERLHHARVQRMLHPKDARGKGRRIVAGEHRHRPLRQNTPMVVLVVHQMHSHPGDLDAGAENGFVNPVAVHALAAKGWEEAGMDVHDAVVKGAHYLARHEPQIAGEHHEVDTVVGEQRGERLPLGMLGSGKQRRRNAASSCARLRPRIRSFARHEHHVAGSRIAERVEVVENRLEVAAAAGGQHRDPRSLRRH